MAMCQGKKKFGTQGLAQEVADRPLSSGQKKPQLYVYQCRACSCFHLSRSPTALVAYR